MKQETNSLILRKSVFIWIALVTVAILLVPFIAMQITSEVQWNSIDFIVMGSMLIGMASLFVLVARRTPRKHRLFFGGTFIAVFLFIWAELAVGIFTNPGS